MGIEVGDIYKVYEDGVFRNNCKVTKIVASTGTFTSTLDDDIELTFMTYRLAEKRMEILTTKVKRHQLLGIIRNGDLVKYEDGFKPMKEFNRYSFVHGI